MTSIPLTTADLTAHVSRVGTPPAAPPAPVLLGEQRIDSRLNGPRRSANGGFAAGLFSRHVDADVVTVVLLRRIPLERRLRVIASHPGRASIWSRRTRVADAFPGVLDKGAVPEPPTFEEAVIARSTHPLAGVRHPLSDCVVCSPARRDGMHVTPGFVPGRPEILAAPWVVGSEELVGGRAPLAAVWAAMDCPSYPAAALRDVDLCLLGTMTAQVDRRPAAREELVVFSWTREHVGRRYETSAAMVDSAGTIIARADATWVSLRHQRLHRLMIGRTAAPTGPAEARPRLWP